ncbi:hypothetical protein GX48_05129 [Paracoccidioides brasiliensis]|nr:hypothetical protein GX48_05129 [Paracoccidioides brasiliensis]
MNPRSQGSVPKVTNTQDASSPTPSSNPSPIISPLISLPSSSTGSHSPSPRLPESDTDQLPPPPRTPMAWMWKCHLCCSKYPLGVTSRCLIDGHCYCSGRPTDRNKQQGQISCTSNFDYVGWKSMVGWQKQVRRASDNEGIREHGCWADCTFPTSCRHTLRFLKLRCPRVVEKNHNGCSDEATSRMQSDTAPASSFLSESEAENKDRTRAKRPLPEAEDSPSDAPSRQRRKLTKDEQQP